MIPQQGQKLKCYKKGHGLTIGKEYVALYVLSDDNDENISILVKLDTNENGFYPLSFFSRSERVKELLSIYNNEEN
jgi:hypothetical protein